MSGSSTRAWIMASSVRAMEALKDQLGVCRWNYVLRSFQQHAKNNIRSYTQAKKLSFASSAVVASQVKRTKEEKMRKLRDLDCWVPLLLGFDVGFIGCLLLTKIPS